MRLFSACRRVLDAKALVCCPLRSQSTISHLQKAARSFDQHPLAAKDPAKRSLTVPDGFHASPTSREARSQDELARRAKRVLSRKAAEDLLWPGTKVRDVSHDLVQHFMKSRADPRYRAAKRMVVVGSRNMIEELARSKIYPRTLLIAGGGETPEWAKRRCEVVPVTEAVAAAVDPGGDGYIGDYSMPDPPPIENLIANRQRLDRVLVLDNITDPGNLGTLLRTSAAFAYDAVLLVNNCVDLYHHSVVRAARGVHFLPNAPFYVLRDEDGNDSTAFMNHVMRRNELTPVVYSPLSLEEQRAEKSSGLLPTSFFNTGSKSGTQAGAAATSPATASASASLAKNLFSFMSDTFGPDAHRAAPAAPSPSSPPNESASSGTSKVGGILLVAGPDHKANMAQRMERRLAQKPTVLLLDAQEEGRSVELMTSLPTVLHALRPRGEWDYLLPAERQTNPAEVGASIPSSRVQIGPDHARLPEPSLDEDEQTAEAMERLNWKVNRRRLRRQRTDDGYWTQFEGRRLAAEALNRSRGVSNPLERHIGSEHAKQEAWRVKRHAHPDWVPNVTTDYMEFPDRDSLRHEVENAKQEEQVEAADAVYGKRMLYTSPSGKIRNQRTPR